ncbi:hypothetical protein Psi02_67630 [Planotetraspora silvatica]|uniref:Uncharacterized protein n=1 Tax=Planotetraspora silvatica TaxID=234614 RepID=A0A8J3UXQ6_9ACTN|nr:hypothetical protein Psi02_67630 [Planotetraspora silvatica]
MPEEQAEQLAPRVSARSGDRRSHPRPLHDYATNLMFLPVSEYATKGMSMQVEFQSVDGFGSGPRTGRSVL